jgi:hypothetical protein
VFQPSVRPIARRKLPALIGIEALLPINERVSARPEEVRSRMMMRLKLWGDCNPAVVNASRILDAWDAHDHLPWSFAVQ